MRQTVKVAIRAEERVKTIRIVRIVILTLSVQQSPKLKAKTTAIQKARVKTKVNPKLRASLRLGLSLMTIKRWTRAGLATRHRIRIRTE